MKDKKDIPKFEIHFHDKVGAQIAYVEHFHAQFDKDMNMQVMDVNGEINKALKELDTDNNEISNCKPSTDKTTDHAITLSTARQTIFNQLLDLADKGDWVNGITAENVKAMLKIVLGQGENPLTGNEAEQSETLWRLLENGRGDRLTIVWQNLVGYLDDRKLFRHIIRKTKCSCHTKRNDSFPKTKCSVFLVTSFNNKNDSEKFISGVIFFQKKRLKICQIQGKTLRFVAY